MAALWAKPRAGHVLGHAGLDAAEEAHPRQPAALGENRNINRCREPIHDRAQRCKCLDCIACLHVEPGKVSGCVQFKEACRLLARPRDRSVKTPPGLLVLTLPLPDAAAQPNDVRELILFLGRFGMLFGFTDAGVGLLDLVRAQLILAEHRHVPGQHKDAACLAPKVDAASNIRQPPFRITQLKQNRPPMQQNIAGACVEAMFFADRDSAVGARQCLGVAAETR